MGCMCGWQKPREPRHLSALCTLQLLPASWCCQGSKAIARHLHLQERLYCLVLQTRPIQSGRACCDCDQKLPGWPPAATRCGLPLLRSLIARLKGCNCRCRAAACPTAAPPQTMVVHPPSVKMSQCSAVSSGSTTHRRLLVCLGCSRPAYSLRHFSTVRRQSPGKAHWFVLNFGTPSCAIASRESQGSSTCKDRAKAESRSDVVFWQYPLKKANVAVSLHSR